MSNNEKFIGRIYNFNPSNNTIIVKIDFIDPDQQEILETLAIDQSLFTFSFKKPYKQGKQYYQLKHYFQMLKTILIKLDIFPDTKNIKALDEEIKKTCLPCEMIQVDDVNIPVVPSKRDLDFDAMEALNKIVEERYAKLLDNNILGE